MVISFVVNVFNIPTTAHKETESIIPTIPIIRGFLAISPNEAGINNSNSKRPLTPNKITLKPSNIILSFGSFIAQQCNFSAELQKLFITICHNDFKNLLIILKCYRFGLEKQCFVAMSASHKGNLSTDPRFFIFRLLRHRRT